MDLSVAFLGTGGAVPSARRNTASVLVARGGERLLFDCGEGTQRQMQRSLGLVQVDAIYFTHFHADHFLGLPGLLKTYDLTERERPLTIYGPRGLRDLIQSLGRVIGRVGYKLDLVELEPGDAIPCDGGEIRSFPVEHSVRAFGYALVEAERPGRFDPEAAKRLGRQGRPGFRRPAARRERRGLLGPGRARRGDGRVAPRPHDRRSPATPHPATRRSKPHGAPSCSSTTPASPRRRPSAPPTPATRPSARPPPSPARPRSSCSPWSTSPPATTSARCSRRPRRSSSRPSPRATST